MLGLSVVAGEAGCDHMQNFERAARFGRARDVTSIPKIPDSHGQSAPA